MKKILTQLFNIPWHPIAFGAYPVVTLLAANSGQTQPIMVIRPLLISILLAGLLFLLFRLILRNIHRAAFVTTLWLVLFFSYGHAFNLLSEKYPNFNITPWTVIAVIGLSVMTLWWATRPKLNFASSASGLNVITLGLLVMSVSQINLTTGPRSAHALGTANAPVERLTLPQNPPDIYFFLLDSYGRSDVLQQAYNYDNSDFIKGLEKRGFYVAKCSQSNYVRTDISLASSLNMMYLQDLDGKFTPDSTARTTLWNSLKHSAVRYDFENMGYTTINFASSFAWLELSDAGKFLSPPPYSNSMTDFEGLFLRTTLARFVKDWGGIDPDALFGQGFRDRFNFIFNSIDNVVKMKSPKFAYIHIISPHPPFVFDAQGNPTYPPDFWNGNRQYPPDLYAKGYVNQAKHLNEKMLAAVDTILANSKTPPIIIIQGDHGPWMQPNNKRTWILNAYYLPGHNDKLYPTITPVNSFRLVFDTYFGGKYDMLKDTTYYSPTPKLYQFTEIPNTCKP